MNPNRTGRRTPRAADAIRTVRIARALAALAPDAARVRLTPVWTDRAGVPRMATVVLITDNHGRPTGSQTAHRVARDILRQQYSRANWARQQRYDVHRGRLTPLYNAFGPAELTEAGR